MSTTVIAPVVVASKFISSEVAKFARSNTRIYLALVLDVIHAHNAIVPSSYAATVQELAPHLTMLPKYCTVIRPALASTHAATLKEFGATVEGLTKAVAWYENQAKLSDYSMSLEDMVLFFKGKVSTKARAKALAEADEKAQALALMARTDDKGDVSLMQGAVNALTNGAAVERTDAAIGESARKQVADLLSSVGSHVAQAHAELTQDVPHGVSDTQPLEQGPAVDGERTSYSLTIHTSSTSDRVTVTGLDCVPMEVLEKAMAQMQALIELAKQAA